MTQSTFTYARKKKGGSIVYQIRPVITELLTNYIVLYILFSPVTTVLLVFARALDVNGFIVGLVFHAIFTYFLTVSFAPKTKITVFPERKEVLIEPKRETIHVDEGCRLVFRRTNEVWYNTTVRKPKSWLRKLKKSLDEKQREIYFLSSAEFDLDGYKARIPKPTIPPEIQNRIDQLREEIRRNKSSRLVKYVDTNYRIQLWCPNGKLVEVLNFGTNYRKAVRLVESLTNDLNLKMIDHTGAVPVLVDDTDKKLTDMSAAFGNAIGDKSEFPKKFTKSFYNGRHLLPILLMLIISAPAFLVLVFFIYISLDEPVVVGALLFMLLIPLMVFMGIVNAMTSLYRKEIVTFDFDRLWVKQVILTLVSRRVKKMDLRSVERIIPVWQDDLFFLELVSDDHRIPFAYTNDYKELFPYQRILLETITGHG